MKIYLKYKSLLNSYHVNTPLRIAHFMAQIEHESGLKPISENLNYSAMGLVTTFSKYFKPDFRLGALKKEIDLYNLDTRKKASDYARKPEKIANLVYANRMGNGNELSGDGWKYRGRGFIQITGKSNYILLSKDTRIDFLTNPDLLLTEANSMISALWYWNKNKINLLADKNDINAVTKSINGGFNGLAHRKELLKKYINELA